jgi:hypothetical protein
LSIYPALEISVREGTRGAESYSTESNAIITFGPAAAVKADVRTSMGSGLKNQKRWETSIAIIAASRLRRARKITTPATAENMTLILIVVVS